MGSYIRLDSLYQDVIKVMTKKIGKRRFYSMLGDVVSTLDPLIQIQQTLLNLCGARGINSHIYTGSCCPHAVDAGLQKYKVITNCCWTS